LLDEPTSALDAVTRDELLAELIDLIRAECLDNVGNERYWASITPSSQNGYNASGRGTGTLGAPRTVRATIQMDLL